MNPSTSSDPALWPFLVYAIAVAVVVAAQIVLSHFLGERRPERPQATPYESGIVSTGSARLRFSATFYLVAMLFVVFDLEAVYLIAWSISFEELGWSGYCKMLFFTFVLALSLVYLWRVGGLEAGPPKRKSAKSVDKA